ncbi:hypothetical protein FOMPIDRAFT_44288 [Fomitopsis schrenkii]|uniref:AB hydrolase-1 domain-containing protein n=1 Tax=Fomitopsis schrenkii TaxID=2126942 RepID=S8ELX9_FOMSC|nr:hypothetical protein FOMPIDRAFT_44288 [Fomitopsis schrenkii]
MPRAPVDQSGTHLYYEDTGAPPGCSEYTTLVLVHGGAFNGAVYRHLFPHAAKYGLRLVALNLREYRGSTPYSPSDLAALGSGDMRQQLSMLQARGLEIATFLVSFIRKENIPPPSNPDDYNQTRGGGLSVLGWSWGNSITIAFLAQAAKLPDSERHLLDAYLRGFILYGQFRHALGVPREIMEGLYFPTRDPNVRPEDKGRVFGNWVSGYYAHSPAALAAFPSVTLDELRNGLQQRVEENPLPQHVASVARMSAEELADITDPAVLTTSHVAFGNIDPAVYKKHLDAALLDASVWPRVRVSLVWCDMSPPETLLSTWYLANQLATTWPQGARKVDLVRFEGANHFPHWDEPERTTKVLAGLI